jgi:carbon starvation protein
MAAPAFNPAVPESTPSIWPFMFVIIACGAISGFHSLVASGTSPKQIASETDALFVGYGSMLLEGALAVLVLICVGAGIGLSLNLENGLVLTGHSAWEHYYGTWIGAKGLTDKLAPVVEGAANLMAAVGIPVSVGVTLMGVFVASFAGTTLDTAVRLQRYVVGELASELGSKRLGNRWTATSFAVFTAALLAFAAGADGTGAMRLWPLFGGANQLLAALALLVVTLYLKRKSGRKYLVTAIPCLIMLVITNWAMIENLVIFLAAGNWLLVIIGALIFALALWMTVEAVVAFFAVPVLLKPPEEQEVSA